MSKRKAGALLAILTLGTAGFFLVAPWRAFLLVMAGRGTGCPLDKAIRTRSAMDDRSAAMKRIASASRIAGEDAAAGIDLWETPDGKYWLPKNRNAMLASLLAGQEQQIYGAGEQGVHPHDIVLDCGAKAGVFTRQAIAVGARQVVAIEPSPQNLECLRRNLAPEIAEGRVAVVAEPVPSIDALVERLHLEHVDFIKMDLDGAEQSALLFAGKTISTYRPRLAIYTYTPSDPERIPYLARAGWREYRTLCGPCEERDYRIVPRTILFY